MTNETINLKGILVIVFLIALAGFSRIIPHIPNFTAIGAMAIFGSAHFSKKYLAILVPVLSIWFSDLFINNFIYETSTHFVWFQSFQFYTILPMVLISFLGFYLFKKYTVSRITIAAILASVIFFLVSNFGTWLSSFSLFPKTLGGLYATYVVGLPFALNTLAGNLFYSLILFGIYHVLTYQFPHLKLIRVRNN